MAMATRRTRDPHEDPPQLVIDLDPNEIERKKARRLYHLHVVQIPTLRILGFCLLVLCIFFHNLLVLQLPPQWIVIEIALIVISYSIFSWIILYLWFESVSSFDLSFLFLVVDVFIWTLMVYFSGGEKSLLFWLMVMRVADQINAGFKRALFFGHLSVFCYGAMLVYLITVEHRPILLRYELPKMLVIYGSNLYIAITARTSEQYRNHVASAVRVARDLILQLNDRSRQLAESKARVEQLSRQNELILLSAGEGIYGLDLQGRATFVNPAVAQMTGYTVEELLGRPMHTLLFHSKADARPHAWEDCPVFATLTLGAVHQGGEALLWRKNGTKFPVEFVSTPIREGEIIVGAVVTFNDISERKRVEAALQRVKEELELKVEARTIELKRVNEQLLADIVMRRRAEAALAAEARFLRAQIEVAKVALSSLRPEDFAQPLLETIGRAQGYAYGALWRVGEDGHTVTMVAAFGEGVAPFVGLSPALSELNLYAASIIRARRPAYHNRLWESPYGYLTATTTLNAQALLGLPLINRTGRVVGAMTFAELEDANRFTLRDLTQGTVLANQVAQAIENSELFSQVNRLQEQYRVVTEALNDAVFTLDAEARFAFGNAAGERLTGYHLEELLGRSFIDLVAPENLPELIDRFRRAITGEVISPHVQIEMIRKDGSRVPIELSMANLVLDGQIIGRVGVARDITDRKYAEEQIRASLQEKEVLLKEIHHRVKNNLQIISSLLNLQSKYINDPQSLQMFVDSQNRVKSMAIIHEILFRSRDITNIDFSEYIKTLSVQLFRSYGANAKKIALEIHVRDIILDVDTAISCGLIVTELVSNSLKHAFVDGREGVISVALFADDDDSLRLVVRDSGIGLMNYRALEHVESLGLKLVNALVNQLAGTVEVDSSPGTTFMVSFPHDKRQERKDGYESTSDHGC
jgi:PAS domain S-box-containing protein